MTKTQEEQKGCSLCLHARPQKDGLLFRCFCLDTVLHEDWGEMIAAVCAYFKDSSRTCLDCKLFREDLGGDDLFYECPWLHPDECSLTRPFAKTIAPLCKHYATDSVAGMPKHE